jgi:hypothetical protein
VSSQHPLSDGYAYGTVTAIHTTSHHYSASSGKPSVNNNTMLSIFYVITNDMTGAPPLRSAGQTGPDLVRRWGIFVL